MRHLPGTLWQRQRQRQRQRRHSPFSIKIRRVREPNVFVRSCSCPFGNPVPCSELGGIYNIIVCMWDCLLFCYGLAAANDLLQGLLSLSDCQSFSSFSFLFFWYFAHCISMGFTIAAAAAAANIFWLGFFCFFFWRLKNEKKRRTGWQVTWTPQWTLVSVRVASD